MNIYGTLMTAAAALSISAAIALPFAAESPASPRLQAPGDEPKLLSPPVDSDGDGIPDATEAMLLETYRPYLRFSRDNGDNETFRPADVGDYLRASEIDGSGKEGGKIWVSRASMAQKPEQINSLDIGGASSSVVTNPTLSSYHVNPTNAERRGNPWNEVLASKRIGLYGHVVPIHLASAEQYDCTHLPTSADDKLPLFYKIEYWQFFGYSSNDKISDLGDHEADWDTVQMIYQPADPATHRLGQIKTVLFYAHGKEMAFDMSSATSSVPMDNGTVTEFRGANYNKPVPNLHDAGAEAKARNHVLRMYIDPVHTDAATGRYTHPVVFVEHGGHEFWPSPDWRMLGAQKHGGDDLADSYLTETPPNLGEVEHPLSEYPYAAQILQFNGYWGTYSRALPGFFNNNPPPGPPLHYQWTYPATSSVRWQLEHVETK